MTTDAPRLRICMVTTFYPPYNFGGDGVYVHRLANALADRGHHVEVIHCVDAYRLMAGREPDGRYEDQPGVVVHGLRSPFGILSPLATHQTGRPLLKGSVREILDRGFDVIHYHNISLVGGPAILEYGRGIKLYSLHEYWLVCPTHVLYRFNRAPCLRPHCLACTLAYRRPPQVWRYTGLLQRALTHVDAFISSSRFTIEAHRARGLTLPAVHIPHFTPLPDPRPAAASGSHPDHERAGAPGPHPASGGPMPQEGYVLRGPYFLYVGRLERYKGLHTLIPVFRRNPAARLLVAGTGTYERQVRRLARDVPNIQFLGHVAPARLQTLYRGAVAVIVPTLAYEIFGMVVIEGFSNGTPAIVRKTGGMPELIEDSGGGFVYTTDAELAGIMSRLLDDPALRREVGARGFQAYLKNWTPDVHLDRYLGLIRQIADARGRPLGTQSTAAAVSGPVS